jgi:hypothetical protein
MSAKKKPTIPEPAGLTFVGLTQVQIAELADCLAYMSTDVTAPLGLSALAFRYWIKFEGVKQKPAINHEKTRTKK